MILATTVRRLLALGCAAGLGALLGGCAALDDPYATSAPPGVYDRGGIYSGSGGGVYVPGTPYPQPYPAYPSAVPPYPVYPAYPPYPRADGDWRRAQEQREREQAWRERERARDQQRAWQQRHDRDQRDLRQQRQEEARRQREREQAQQQQWQQRRDQWLQQQEQQKHQQQQNVWDVLLGFVRVGTDTD